MKRTMIVFVLTALALLCSCHDHTWAEATCLSPATCTECGDIEDETLAEHLWIGATCVEPKTCSVCSLSEGEPLPHAWLDATCGAPKTCSVCDAAEGEPIGEHHWIEATCDAPKTCTVCGSTEGQKLRHNSSQATCTEARTCIYCGKAMGDPLGHVFTEATCYAAPSCRRCGFAEGNPLPHNLVNDICTVCGYYVRPSVHPNAAYAKYFDINPNIKWVDNPSTRNELVNNILWNALNGDFNFEYIKNTSYAYNVTEDQMIAIFDGVIEAYPEVLGAYLNVVDIRDCSKNSIEYELRYDSNPLPLSYQDVHNQNIAALMKAQSMSKKLHDNGTITDSMSQTEIMKAYYDYLQSLDIAGKGSSSDMYYDTAYGCLVNKQAACGGRAAAFNLLMHVDGIAAQGISGQIIGTNSGHIISRVVADGTEYFVDWGNHKPISTYEQACKWFNFNHEDSMTVLELARNAG